MSYSFDVKIVDGHALLDLAEGTEPNALPLMIRITGHHVRPGERSSESISASVLRPHSSVEGDVEHVINASASTTLDRTGDTTA